MSNAGKPVLACESLNVDVPGRVLVRGLDLVLERGEFLAVLGRNGTGKTLTLMTLAGLRSRGSGSVSLFGDAIESWGRQRVARHLAVLPQDTEDIFPSTVLDTVLIGRHPHIGRWRWESAADREIAVAALARTGIDKLAGRDVLTLSGGERQRLAIAQVLAQSPEVFLLDEPTNHLDPRHQELALRLFRDSADSGSTIIASLHDANLAERYADRCLLLHGDGRWELGPTRQILTAARLGELYGTAIEDIPWRGGRVFVPAPPP
jgi:iron complex transport system ATP-binding protein